MKKLILVVTLLVTGFINAQTPFPEGIRLTGATESDTSSVNTLIPILEYGNGNLLNKYISIGDISTGGSNPTWQQTLDESATATTNPTISNLLPWLTVYNSGNFRSANYGADNVLFSRDGYNLTLQIPTLTANATLVVPPITTNDTLALKSDITGGSSFDESADYAPTGEWVFDKKVVLDTLQGNGLVNMVIDANGNDIEIKSPVNITSDLFVDSYVSSPVIKVTSNATDPTDAMPMQQVLDSISVADTNIATSDLTTNGNRTLTLDGTNTLLITSSRGNSLQLGSASSSLLWQAEGFYAQSDNVYLSKASSSGTIYDVGINETGFYVDEVNIDNTDKYLKIDDASGNVVFEDISVPTAIDVVPTIITFSGTNTNIAHNNSKPNFVLEDVNANFTITATGTSFGDTATFEIYPIADCDITFENSDTGTLVYSATEDVPIYGYYKHTNTGQVWFIDDASFALPVEAPPAVETAMILEITTIGASELVTIPTTGTSNVTIDWGDGSSPETFAGSYTEFTHTYATTDVYEVSIEGDFAGLYGTTTSNTQITDVKNWGTSQFDEIRLRNIKCDITATDVPDLTNVTSLQYFVRDNGYNITSLDVSSWNTSTITNMNGMFWSAGFAEGGLIGVGNWDTSNVTNMSYMFANDNVILNHDLSGWDIEDVTNFTGFNSTGTRWDSANIDATLIGWAAQTPQTGVTINLTSGSADAAHSRTSASNAAYTTLTTTYGWTIIDAYGTNGGTL